MQKPSVFFFLFFLLVFLSIRFFVFYSQTTLYKDKQKVSLRTSITSEPIVSGRTQRFRIKLNHSYEAFVTTGKFPQYFYGQTISVAGKMQVREKEGRMNYSLFYPQVLLSEKEGFLSVFSRTIRDKAIHLYGSVLSPDTTALLLGIVLGAKTQMSEEFLTDLRSAGVMHVIAASGMNVTMVAGALFSLFSYIFSRRTGLVLSFLGVLFYAFIAGFEPSIVRASIMAGLTFLASILGKQKHAIYLLGVTAYGMLFIEPVLLYDIGFQLSFLATLGIMLLKPLIQLGKIGEISVIRVIREDFLTTLAAQIATLPILLINFGSVNVLSLIVNVLVLWTIPFLMVIGGFSLLVGFLFPPLGSIIAALTIPFLWFFEKIVSFFGVMKLPLIFESDSFILWLGYYLTLVAFIVFRYQKKNSAGKRNS